MHPSHAMGVFNRGRPPFHIGVKKGRIAWNGPYSTGVSLIVIVRQPVARFGSSLLRAVTTGTRVISPMEKSRNVDHDEELEWNVRCDMAAVFRVCARLNMNEQVGNHISMMLPTNEGAFLINPRGSLFQDIRASDLVICNLDGELIRGRGDLKKIAINIHARIHVGNPEAKCVIHAHPPYLTALSLIEDGRFELAHHNNLMINDRVAYDDEQHGLVHESAEGDRICRLSRKQSCPSHGEPWRHSCRTNGS